MYFMVSGTEIRLLSQMWKKTVHGGPGCEDDRGVREDLDTLRSELLQGDAFYADEGPVGDFHVVFLGQFVERGLFR